MTPIWIVGQAKDEDGTRHEMQGAFDSKELAISACRTDLYWIMEVALNVNQPHESVDTAHLWYPHREPEPTKS